MKLQGIPCIPLLTGTAKNTMTGWMDEGEAVEITYLDFRKAFDTVSYNIVHKLGR